MENIIETSIRTGLAYLRATNFSEEAWNVILRNAEKIGEPHTTSIIKGIKEKAEI